MKLDDAFIKLLIRGMKRIDGITEFEGIDSEYEFKMYKIPPQKLIRIDLTKIEK